MKAYIITTGTAFGLITIAHIARMAVEHRVAREPLFLLLTLLAAGLTLWAFSLLRRLSRS